MLQKFHPVPEALFKKEQDLGVGGRLSKMSRRRFRTVTITSL